MKMFDKGIALALTAAILLSLCLTLTVFATEELPGGGGASIESAIETERTEEKPGPPADAPSDVQEDETLQPDHSDNAEPSSAPTEPAVTAEPPAGDTTTETEPPEGGAAAGMEPPAGGAATGMEPPAGGAATETEPPAGDTATGTEPPAAGTYIEPVTATPFEAVEPVPPEPDTAATAEELLEWLQEHENSEGALMLTADIFLDDLLYMKNSDKEITIDTGEFSIVAVGEVYFWRSGLTVRGLGGDKGVFRAAEGGGLSIGYMSVEASDGFAVFQEEGAGLVITQCSLAESAVHYAETPFVWEWKYSRAVVRSGQTASDVLPETVGTYYVNRMGEMKQEGDVPVVWDLSGHGAAEEQRLRFEAAGSTPGFASFRAPVCTVVYDDFPLTFLDVTLKKTGEGQREAYFVIGTFSKPEDRLPITIVGEYSFDGETWIADMENEIKDPDTTFDLSLPPGAWDVRNFPHLYIRLSWNDAGTMYYSNVLCFSGDNLEKSEDKGGDRGGGTDIVDPSGPPIPDPEPETAPPPETSEPAPSRPGNNGTDHEPAGGREGAASLPESSGGSHGDTEEPSHGATQKPDLSNGSSDNEAAPPLSGPKTEAGPGPVSAGVLPNEAVVSSAAADIQSSPAPSPSGEEAEISAEPEAETAVPGPDVFSIAAGLAVVAVSMGGAALYLHQRHGKN